jgi:N-dimethylarginine dimethylaminohydrolase
MWTDKSEIYPLYCFVVKRRAICRFGCILHSMRKKVEMIRWLNGTFGPHIYCYKMIPFPSSLLHLLLAFCRLSLKP